MKNTFQILLIVIALFTHHISAQKLSDVFSYFAPAPGSIEVHKESKIAFRINNRNSISSINPSISVSGSIHGKYSGRLILAWDNRTYIFQPEPQFSLNEKIVVDIDFSKSGNNFRDSYYSYSFNITNLPSTEYLQNSDFSLSKQFSDSNSNLVKRKANSKTAVKTIGEVSIPSDFPEINIQSFGTTASGNVFTGNIGGAPYLIIMKNDGTPVYYKKMNTFAEDFKVQPNNILSYLTNDNGVQFFTMDSTYTVIDSFKVGNGYATDGHDFQILPNGHVLMIGLDYRIVDMSLIVPGGKSNAKVAGNAIIEFDQNKNVVFEWKSWDHFNITDCIGIDLTQSTIDYVHINSVEADLDGNLLISSRHLSEITKINRETGDIIWRLGGKNNQFNFINDPEQISWQHDIRVLPNGNYTVFDNGQFHTPAYSRAVEYELNTSAMTANLIWQYRNNPPIFRHLWVMLNDCRTVILLSAGRMQKIRKEWKLILPV